MCCISQAWPFRHDLGNGSWHRHHLKRDVLASYTTSSAASLGESVETTFSFFKNIYFHYLGDLYFGLGLGYVSEVK